MRSFVTAAFMVLFATPTLALPPIYDYPPVRNGFYIIGMADIIRKNCESLQGRMIAGYFYLKAMERDALQAGYSKAQIDALLKNKTEKEKLRRQIEADLAKRGASPKTPEGYCTVGREEIAKGSAVGRLLIAK